jgi:hypothetical protein
MLPNQLPILQSCRKLPEVLGKYASYCKANGANYTKRMFSETDIIAFSDLNDLLSYAILYEFSENILILDSVPTLLQ